MRQINTLEGISKDTFFAAAYLPCHYDSAKKPEVVVTHPAIHDRMFYQSFRIPKTPGNKHLSINSMRVSYKQIKKVKQIRHFDRPTSVFHEFKLDTKEKLAFAFDEDA